MIRWIVQIQTNELVCIAHGPDDPSDLLHHPIFHKATDFKQVIFK